MVSKEFTQVSGKDYGATFSPVSNMRYELCSVVISLAASYSWPLWQLDVKNAFLHGVLTETIYIDLPSGFRGKEKYVGNVYRLKKYLYGLKQSSWVWFSRFSSTVLSMGFSPYHSDHTCFLGGTVLCVC